VAAHVVHPCAAVPDPQSAKQPTGIGPVQPAAAHWFEQHEVSLAAQPDVQSSPW
jgi:hypothetical protein